MFFIFPIACFISEKQAIFYSYYNKGDIMFKKSFTTVLFSLLFAVPAYAADIAIPEDAQNFYSSDKVTKQAVTFLNQY